MFHLDLSHLDHAMLGQTSAAVALPPDYFVDQLRRHLDLELRYDLDRLCHQLIYWVYSSDGVTVVMIVRPYLVSSAATSVSRSNASRTSRQPMMSCAS
jgi:hypothetical protein